MGAASTQNSDLDAHIISAGYNHGDLKKNDV
jgi:hypothetical protein